MERTKILIVSDYHPKETFAVEVGNFLSRESLPLGVKVGKYQDMPRDRKTSTYHLRKFVAKFDPMIPPIVLHGDDALEEIGAAIIYCASKGKKERKKAHRLITNFALRYKDCLITVGSFSTQNTSYSLIEIELNSYLGIKKAAKLIKHFIRYLIKEAF